MKLIPLLRVTNLREAISFYTTILDFKLKNPQEEIRDWGVELIHGDAELQLTVSEGDQRAHVNVYSAVEDVDMLFAHYKERGLDTSKKMESPVHQGPLDQSWGTREFYITDPSGNTLRFFNRFEQLTINN